MLLTVLVSISLLGCTVGEQPAPAWGNIAQDSGQSSPSGESDADVDTDSDEAAEFDPSVAPGCDYLGVLCFLFTGPGWEGIEEETCAATADTRGGEMTYMPEGCPTGAIAYCELPPLEGYPGTEHLLVDYPGAELSSAESSCESKGGTFTRR